MSSRKEVVVGGGGGDGVIALSTGEQDSAGEAFRTLSSSDDTVVLEDDSGRVELTISRGRDEIGDNFKVCEMVTGMVVAVAGKVDEKVRGRERVCP